MTASVKPHDAVNPRRKYSFSSHPQFSYTDIFSMFCFAASILRGDFPPKTGNLQAYEAVPYQKGA